jgi:hypothetical protein
MIYLTVLEKQEQTNPKISTRKEIMEIGQKLRKWRLKEQYKEPIKP